MDKIVQQEAFEFTPDTRPPLGVFETAHNIMYGQWYTFTVESGRSAKCVVSFNEGFKHGPEWKEKIGNVYVQRNRKGMIGAVKKDL